MFDRVRFRFHRWIGFDPDMNARAKLAWSVGVLWWRFRRRTLVRLRGTVRPILSFLAVCIAAVVLIFAVWYVPTIVDSQRIGSITEAKERASAANDSRVLMLQTILALGGLFTVIYTARSYFLSKAGQVSDRLISATDRLAADSSVQRVGGVYAVARLMKESSADHQGLVDILSSFIRDRARDGGHPHLQFNDPEGEMADDETYEYMWSWVPERVPIDVQAALGALARRPRRPELPWIVLGGTRLVGARLNSRSIQNFHFEHTDMRGSDFAGTRTHAFVFSESDVRGANFSGAVLRTGHFRESDMRYSYFRWVDLTGSGFWGSDFRGCVFINAIVHDCDFDEADFRGVDLSTTIGLTMEQIAVAKTDKHTRLPEYLSDQEKS